MRMMHPKEIESVTALDAFERYNYFIKKIADSTVMYSLKSPEGDLAVSEIESKYLLPFWSPIEFAEIGKRVGWVDFNVSEISIPDFEKTYIPIIEARKYLINVFPVNHKTGFVVDLVEFLRDLKEELLKYE